MKLSSKELATLNALPRGAGFPISTRDICRITGLGERDTRDIMNGLISRYGVPIVASRSKHGIGMFIATNEEELNIGIASFKTQVATMNARIRAIEQADLNGWETSPKTGY